MNMNLRSHKYIPLFNVSHSNCNWIWLKWHLTGNIFIKLYYSFVWIKWTKTAFSLFFSIFTEFIFRDSHFFSEEIKWSMREEAEWVFVRWTISFVYKNVLEKKNEKHFRKKLGSNWSATSQIQSRGPKYGRRVAWPVVSVVVNPFKLFRSVQLIFLTDAHNSML